MRTRTLAAAALALAAPSVLAAGRPIEIKDFYKLETAGNPALSPDGRLVAYVRSYVVEAENRRNSEIWLASADGSAAPRRLTSPAFSSTAPRFSPDGTLLAFTSRRRAPGAARVERGEADDEASAWFLRLDAPGGEAFQ